MRMLGVKELKDIGPKERYRVKVQRSMKFQRTYITKGDIITAWESIREDIKVYR